MFVSRSMVLVYHCYNCIMMHTCSCNKKRRSCVNCEISVFIKTEKYLTCVTSDMISDVTSDMISDVTSDMISGVTSNMMSDVTFKIRNTLRKSSNIGCNIRYDIGNDIISGVTSNTISEMTSYRVSHLIRYPK